MDSSVGSKLKPGDTPQSRSKVIRKGPWKLLSTKDKTVELYNLVEDLGETKNLAKTYPERTA